MQTVQALREAVKRGEMTKEAALSILDCVASQLEETQKTFQKLASEDPSMEKYASLGRGLVTALLSSAALALGGMGVNALFKNHEDKKMEQLHQKSFQEMFRVRPEIKTIPEEKVQEYFSIFADLSPNLAKNPFIAANFVQRQANGFGGVGFEEAGQIARTEEQIKRNQGQPLYEQAGNEMIRQGVGGVGAAVQQAGRRGVDAMMDMTGAEKGLYQADHDMARFQSIRDRAQALGRIDPDAAQAMVAATMPLAGKERGYLAAAEKIEMENALRSQGYNALSDSYKNNSRIQELLIKNQLEGRAGEDSASMLTSLGVSPTDPGYREIASREKNRLLNEYAAQMIGRYQ